MLDIDDIADVVAGAVREATAPLLKRIDELERRELLLPEKGDPGEPGLPGEKGADGEVDMEVVGQLIAQAVERAVADLPLPEKGEPGKDGEPGVDGEVDMEQVYSFVEQAVNRAVEALPAPEKGERGADGLPGQNGADGPAGAPGEPGKDGVGLADALIDKDGALVLTLTDGRTKALGAVIGKDGERGEDGKTFTLDDFDIEPIDERTIKLGFVSGEIMHSFELEFPFPIYRHVFKDSEVYQRGDIVTWAGSAWHCDEPKGLKPGTPDSGWTLMVKAGRPGKN